MQAVIYILVLYFSFACSEVFNTSANELEIAVSLNETKVPILLNASEPSGSAIFDVYPKISDGLVHIENMSNIAEDDLYWLLDVNSTESYGDVFYTTPSELDMLNDTTKPSIVSIASEPSVPPMFEVYHATSDGLVNIEYVSNKAEDDLDKIILTDPTEVIDAFADGCDRPLRKQLWDYCEDNYETISFHAYNIEDPIEKAETLCCALKELEKCTLRASDKANCGEDKAVIRENMKAAYLFVSVVFDMPCIKFSGLCLYSTNTVV